MGNLMLFLLAFRDVLGVNIGIPLRAGEILIAVFPAYAMFHRSSKSRLKRANNISIFLILYFLFSIIVWWVLSPQVIDNYAYKVFARIVLMAVFVYSANHINVSKIKFSFETAMKLIVISVAVMDILQLFGFTIYLSEFAEYNGAYFFGIKRFSGTASEPGYLLPVLILPWYYYLQQLKKPMIAVIAFLGLITFSPAVYGGMVFTVLYICLVKRKYKLIVVGLLGLGIILIAVVANESLRESFISIIDKAFSFLNGDSIDFSGKSRLQQRDLALEKIKDFSITELLFGTGLGSYYVNSYDNFKRGHSLEYSISPTNAFLGILFDTGIIGILMWAALIYNIIKIKPNTLECQTILCGIIICLISCIINAALWTYMLWLELGIYIIMARQNALDASS